MNQEIQDNQEIQENYEKDNNKDDGFILIPTKQTGNFSILKRGSTAVNPKKIYYTIFGCFAPFGIEEYNHNYLINVTIIENKNYNYNLMVSLKNMISAFQELKNTKTGKEKYIINDKEFFNFMKCIENDDNKKYQIRLYLKKGCKILDKQNQLKNYIDVKKKRCNIKIEVGSLWVNEKIKKYGVNLYVNEIIIL